jgi:glycerate-2-kinase
MIASGPTVNEPEKILQGMRVMEKYRTTIKESDEKLLHLVNEVISTDYYQTDDKDIHEIMDIYHLIIGSLSIALKSAEESAKRLGYQTRIIAEDITGEAREIGRKLGKLLIIEAESKGESDPPVCLIAGGETTVTVMGNGKGGRNQELALGAAIEMDGYPNCILVALATDGEDSTTDAAGAIVTGKTIQNGIMKNLDPEIFLKNNDSYHYFEQAGGLIKTGPTGTNVNDMILMFVL